MRYHRLHRCCLPQARGGVGNRKRQARRKNAHAFSREPVKQVEFRDYCTTPLCRPATTAPQAYGTRRAVRRRSDWKSKGRGISASQVRNRSNLFRTRDARSTRGARGRAGGRALCLVNVTVTVKGSTDQVVGCVAVSLQTRSRGRRRTGLRESKQTKQRRQATQT